MAGRGFTVKKDWDNPVEHAMPAEARVPAEVRLARWWCGRRRCWRRWPA